MVAEFNALRAEIVNRSTLQLTIASLNVTAAGTLAAVAFANRQNLPVVLVVPLLSLALGLLWLDQAYGIRFAAKYIKEALWPVLQTIDPRITSWEQFLSHETHRTTHWRYSTPMTGIFLGPGVLSLVAMQFTTIGQQFLNRPFVHAIEIVDFLAWLVAAGAWVSFWWRTPGEPRRADDTSDNTSIGPTRTSAAHQPGTEPPRQTAKG